MTPSPSGRPELATLPKLWARQGREVLGRALPLGPQRWQSISVTVDEPHGRLSCGRQRVSLKVPSQAFWWVVCGSGWVIGGNLSMSRRDAVGANAGSKWCCSDLGRTGAGAARLTAALYGWERDYQWLGQAMVHRR
jgi:hypothetical protein